MTTQEPTAAPDPPPGPPAGDIPLPVRRLQRRTSDRVVGGVAGGLADYLNVDPILIRVAFAGLMVFGGAGLVLYVVGWVLMPATGEPESIAQSALRLVARRTGRLGAMVVVVVAAVILSPWIVNRFADRYFGTPEVFWAIAIALIGVVLLLPRDRTDRHRSSEVASTARVERPEGSVAAPAWVQVAVGPRPVGVRSPLGWYILAGALFLIAALAVVDTVATVRVLPGQYLGAGLLALGLGLVVGAWWGRARRAILVGLAVLPLAAASAFLTVPLEGGVADTQFRPQNLAEVESAYHLVAGRLLIDLTGLEAGAEPVTLTATVGIGDLFVIVPQDATVQVTGTVQGGRLWLFGRDHVGTGLADHVAGPGDGAGDRLVLNLDVGIGEVWVERSSVGGS